MAAKQRDMSDSMHYESRQIREALAASNARLKSARSGRVPADLQPQLGAMMLQEWEGLSGTGHLDQDNTLASSNPLYQQMRAALLAFENEVGYAAPARERAFFSALRTQLMEAGTLRDAEQRDMQITAAFKWFSRHKPQGPEADPITAAVLASSLSVEANAAPAQPEMRTSSPGTPLHAATQQQQQQQRLPSPPSPSAAGTGNGGGSSAAMPGSYTKHYFFDVYSRAPLGGGGTSGGGGTPALPSSSGAGPGLRPTSARGPSPGGRSAGRADEAPSLSINHPLAMYPSVSAAAAPPGGATATTSTADKASAAGPASGGNGGSAQPRARFASTEMYAPAKLVRPQEFDELDHRAAQVAAAAAAAGVSGAAAADHGGVSGGGAARSAAPVHPKPWVSGPHKPTLGGLTAVLGGGGSGGGGGGGGGTTAVGHTSKPSPEEEEEVQVLRSKWSEMETKTAKSVADVQVRRLEGRPAGKADT
ncbi:hypothetical protein Vretifemale_17265 [Volvox reticuliferus]|uniref:Uncharacterized protein n=1 Tax=Volvox reticuliferus TaxID=1737510 RepID=A0A8J4FWZ9_9CHLO|nr:hypothetical protein Vretifemale_17265 [Volvox reticuliferus]